MVFDGFANQVFDEADEALLSEVESKPEAPVTRLHHSFAQDHRYHPCPGKSFTHTMESNPTVEQCYVAILCPDRQVAQSCLHKKMARFMQQHGSGDAMSAPKSIIPGPPRNPEVAKPRCPTTIDAALISRVETTTQAILDTGASRPIIGDKTWERLREGLPEHVRNAISKRPSEVKFRFGNNQSLTSMYQVRLPLKHSGSKKLWLSIEVVPGNTPFLFSKRAFKSLHGSLDTRTDSCQPTALSLSPTGLYLIDMVDLCEPPSTSCFAHDFVGNATEDSEQVHISAVDGDKSMRCLTLSSSKKSRVSEAILKPFRQKPLWTPDDAKSKSFNFPRALSRSSDPSRFMKYLSSDHRPHAVQHARGSDSVEDRRRIDDPVVDASAASVRAAARTT